MNANLDKFCFQVKDILRNYGKQQTAEGTMTAEVIMEYLIFIKFFEPYSPKLHGVKRLKVFDKMIEQYPYIKTFNSFMEPYTAKKATEGQVITNTDKQDILEAEANLHNCISKCEPTSKIFNGTKSLLEMIAFDECTVKLLEALYQADFKLDDVGDIHEYFIQDEAKHKSKMYGQFFTPNEICMKAIDIVKPRLRADGSMPDCLDPAAGSFKFMRNLARRLAQETNTPYGDILLNNCHGCEIENKAYKALQYNILMDTGDISDNVYNANSLKYLMYGKGCQDDSFTNLPDYDTTKRYDYIFANPPFGCKAEVDMYVKEYVVKPAKGKTKEKREAVYDYMMKTRNSDGMFIQLIIHLLKIGGEACVVLCGSIFNKDLSALRKHWLETCNLKSITVCPKDMFKNTSIETYLFHFVKGEPTKEIIYYNFDGTEIGRRIDFGDGWDVSVPRVFKVHNLNSIVTMKLGDVCVLNAGKRIVLRDAPEGEFPVYGGGDISCHTNQYNREGTNCKISREGMSLHNCVMVISGKYYQNSQGMTVESKDRSVMLDKFLWHYLEQNKRLVYDCGEGTAQRAIVMSRFNDLDIPVPPIEVQNELVSKLEALDKNIELTKAKIEADKEYMKILLEVETQGCEQVRLGNVCKVKSGKATSKDKLDAGDIPVWGGGVKPMGFTNKETHRKGTIVVSKDGANAGYIHRLLSNAFLTGSANFLYDISNTISEDFLYFTLKYLKQSELTSLQGNPTAQPHVYPQQIENIMISILEKDQQDKLTDILIKQYKTISNLFTHVEHMHDLKSKVLNQIMVSQSIPSTS